MFQFYFKHRLEKHMQSSFYCICSSRCNREKFKILKCIKSQSEITKTVFEIFKDKCYIPLKNDQISLKFRQCLQAFGIVSLSNLFLKSYLNKKN